MSGFYLDRGYDYGWRVTKIMGANLSAYNRLPPDQRPVGGNVLQQVTHPPLSSGTYATLTGFNRYSDLDPIEQDFIEFVRQHQDEYVVWQDAWNAFWAQNRSQYGKALAGKWEGFGNPPVESGNWSRFAQAIDWGMLDLDTFAQYMGYQDDRDLELSITPRALYQRNPDRFIQQVQGISRGLDTNTIVAAATKALARRGALKRAVIDPALDSFWVVAPNSGPDADYTFVDLCFQTDIRGLMMQVRGGLDWRNILLITKDRQKATNLTNTILKSGTVPPMAGAQIDGALQQMWVVTTPTSMSTIDDIFFKTDLHGLMLQFLGGLDYDSQVLLITQDQGTAQRKANSLIRAINKSLKNITLQGDTLTFDYGVDKANAAGVLEANGMSGLRTQIGKNGLSLVFDEPETAQEAMQILQDDPRFRGKALPVGAR